MNATTTNSVRPNPNPIAIEPASRSTGDAPAGDSFEALLGRTQIHPGAVSRQNVLEKGQAFGSRATSKPGTRQDFRQSLKSSTSRREICKPERTEQGNRAGQVEKSAKAAQAGKASADAAAEELRDEQREACGTRPAEHAEEISAWAQAAWLQNNQVPPPCLAKEEFVPEESSGSAGEEKVAGEIFDSATELLSDKSARAKVEKQVAIEPGVPEKPEHLKDGKVPELAFDVEKRFGNAAHADKTAEAAKLDPAAKLVEPATLVKQAEKISPARAEEISTRAGNAIGAVKTPEAVATLTEARGQQPSNQHRDSGASGNFSTDTTRLLAADLAVQRSFSVSGGASAMVAVPSAGMISKLTEDVWAAVNEFKVKGGDRVEVQLQTDAQTRLRLEIWHERGAVEVRARLEGGDLMALTSGWSDLQNSMADRGVTLRQLESELPQRQQPGQSQAQLSFDAEARRDAFAQARQRRLLAEEGAAPLRALRPVIPAVAAVKAGTPSAVRAGDRRGWESWA